MNYKKARIEAVVLTIVLLGAMFLAPASSFMANEEKNSITEQGNNIIYRNPFSTEEELQSYILDRNYDIYPDPAPISKDGSNDDAGYKKDATDEFKITNKFALYPGEIIDDTPGRGRTGKLSSSDDQDWYFITVCEGQEIVITMTPPSGHDYGLSLWDNDEVKRDESTNVGDIQESISYIADYSGKWHICINYIDGTDEGQYSFEVTLVGQNDAGTADDAGDSFADATLIVPGEYYGYLDPVNGG